METVTVVGFVVTGVVLVVFLGWTWHELRRVDRLTGSSAESED